MRTTQMSTSISTGWQNLPVADPRVHTRWQAGSTTFAVPLVPGRAKRFHSYPASRRRRLR